MDVLSTGQSAFSAIAGRAGSRPEGEPGPEADLTKTVQLAAFFLKGIKV